MKLSELIKTKDVPIPGTDLIVKMYEDVAWYDFVKSTQIKDEDDRGVFLLSKLIESWNLLGDDEKPLPVTEEIIKKLPMKIGSAITIYASELIKAHIEKKKD